MDLTGSPPVPIKKTLALVNNFIVDTTRFLNHFATLADEKLHRVSADITRIETALLLLESRLSHVEGLEDAMPPLVPTGASFAMGQSAESIYAVTSGVPSAVAAPPAPAPAPVSVPTASSAAAPAGAAAVTPAATPAAPAPPPEPVVPKMREHPSYAKYYKLLSMNLAPENLKLRMTQEGLKPELLDTPDAPISAAGDDIAASMMAGGSAGSASTAAAAAPPAPAAPRPPPPPGAGAGAAPSAADGGAGAGAGAAAAMGGGGFVALKDDPTLAPLFKMLRVGTPLGAVQQKAKLLGIDPSLLERDPESPSPYAPMG